MQLATIRAWQMTRMELGIRTVESIFGLMDDGTLTRYRDGGTGWTAHQVLGHLRDFEDVILTRARLTVNEENPLLPFPNPDELAEQRNYHQIPWRTLLSEWQQARTEHLTFLAGRSESDWERPAQHPTRGPFTLHDQIFLTSLHDSLHIEQMTRILKEKNAG